MSLRTRLLFVVLAVVVPSAIANGIATWIDRGIQRQVGELRRETREPLVPAALRACAFSFEGRWDRDGFFAASRIESLPRQRRPKLRGAIESVGADGSISMYGIEIHVPAQAALPQETSSDGGVLAVPPDDALATQLAVGRRVEISCRVEPDGTWSARKIKSDGVKESDKLKGTIRAVRELGGGELELDLDGLRVRTAAGASSIVARGPLHRMEIAAQTTLALQECQSAAQELLKTHYARREALARGESERASRLELQAEDVEDRLLDASEEFAHDLADIRESAEDELERAGSSATRREFELRAIDECVEPLEGQRASFDAGLQHLVELAEQDLDAAQAWLHGSLEPQLRRELAPRVRALEAQAQERLSDELNAIASRSTAASRWSLGTNAAGLVLALVLGLLVARSIAQPVSELRTAAKRIGDGDLAARVAVRSQDELGVLAGTFNRMAQQLSASTVSVARLNDVIDSLAGALFLIDGDGRLTSVNPAALTLLGYAPGELVALTFDDLCGAEAGPGVLRAVAEHGVESRELSLLRKDGSAIPVAFSGAALGGEGSAERGFVCLVEDLRERKRMDEALRRSLAEKELLLRELHHRVKNNLQVICSLLDLQSREVSDPRALEKFQESQDRIRSMVLIHEQLYGARDLVAVDMRVYLGLLASNLVQAHVDPPERIRIEHEVDELHLDLDRALSCGLIVNELVTNSIKHAFGPVQRGRIVIRCRRAGARIELCVADDGRGLRERERATSGHLGMELVRALCDQLRGELSVDGTDGTSVCIEFT